MILHGPVPFTTFTGEFYDMGESLIQTLGYGSFLCRQELRRLWVFPRKARVLWLTAHDCPGRDRVRVDYVAEEPRKGCLLLRVGKQQHDTWLRCSEFADLFSQPRTFYVSLEYEV